MSRPLVIFGAGDIAELAHYYFSRGRAHNVAAFVVDAAYLGESTFCGLPVVALEEVAKVYPPLTHDFFVALSYSRPNQLRKEKCLAAKACGHQLTSHVSEKATVLNDGSIGENCFIVENNTVQRFVAIGSNVTLRSGNHIGYHSTIKDHCFLASHIVVSGGVEIGEQCFISVNATILDPIRLGERCVVGAGTLLLADAGAEGVYMGQATERARLPSSRLRGI